MARDLWFSYNGEEEVLRGVGLSVERGAITMILGRSGCGKTTLLRLLKGLAVPRKGSVEILGENGGGIAYVPQNLGLVRNMSALENVLTGALRRVGLFRSVVGIFPGEMVREAQKILRNLGLGSKENEKVYSLSGGERQRVAVARALMGKPGLILADEFVSQLDPVSAREILGMTKRLAHQEGVSFLITTHEIDIVADYADRVIVMREGKILFDGNRQALSQERMMEMLL